MPPSPDTLTVPALEPVLLVIADISGYTRYMTANAKTLAHSQTIITELITTIVQEVNLPLEVAKLEGDAVFFFGRKGANPAAWSGHRAVIGRKLFTFFQAFSAKLAQLRISTTCACQACAHIDKLSLKVVVHSGEALFHQVLNFQELAGVDVIIVHRLLKNSIASPQYLLLTEAARHDVELPAEAQLVTGSETYDEIGRVNTVVYYPHNSPNTPRETAVQPPTFGKAYALFLKLTFRPAQNLIFTKTNEFQHLTAGGTRAGSVAFGLLMLILAPIYLPLGALVVFLRLRKNHATPSPVHISNRPTP